VSSAPITPPPAAEPPPTSNAELGTAKIAVFTRTTDARSLLHLLDDPRLQLFIAGPASSDGVRHANIRFVAGLDNPARGADSKAAGRLAIDAGADLVVVLTGDEVDAVAAVRAVVDEFVSTRGDVTVHGSPEPPRGLIARSLLHLADNLAGRPLWLGGCRGYSTAFLLSVPFELNRDDCVFDAEIVLQAAHVGATIRQVPSFGARAGGAACSAWQVLAVAAQFRMHRMGMLCALKYRHLTPRRYQDKTFMLYTSHAMALAQVQRARPATLLDIGSGPGFIAARCEAAGVRVTGIDVHEPLPGTMSEFHRVDLERDPLPVDAFAYDCVLMLDVLEHMADPESFLLGLRNQSLALRTSDRQPLVIISTPNVAFAAVRLNLLLGRFNYAERGILDISHKRLFTRSTLRRALIDCGYTIERLIPIGPPFQTVVGGSVGKLLGKISDVMARAWPTMFAFQFIVTCRPRPGVRVMVRE